MQFYLFVTWGQRGRSKLLVKLLVKLFVVQGIFLKSPTKSTIIQVRERSITLSARIKEKMSFFYPFDVIFTYLFFRARLLTADILLATVLKQPYTPNHLHWENTLIIAALLQVFDSIKEIVLRESSTTARLEFMHGIQNLTLMQVGTVIAVAAPTGMKIVYCFCRYYFGGRWKCSLCCISLHIMVPFN